MTMTWSFTVDTLTKPRGDVHLPLNTGTLSVSDAIWSSGRLDFSYVSTFDGFHHTLRESGQIEGWSLNLGPDLVMLGEVPQDYLGSVSLAFNPGGAISGSIVQEGWESWMQMSIADNAATGFAVSDYTVFGCGVMQRCDYTGHWTSAQQPAAPGHPSSSLMALSAFVAEPTQVPEAGTALILAMALLATTVIQRELRVPAGKPL